MAVATVTLGSTTFSQTVESSDSLVNLASLSGVTPGMFLFCDRELLAVDHPTGINTQVIVRRGQGGTSASRHATNSTIYIGRGDQFFSTDPVGLPANESVVYPYINVLNGTLWIAQGDEAGSDVQGRIWSQITTAMVSGALGVRQTVTTTPS